MWLIDKIFEINKEKITKFHMVALIGLTLVIFKVIFRTQFNQIIEVIISGIGQFSFLIKICELTTGGLFILSIMTIIMSAIFMILYLVIDNIDREKSNMAEKIRDYDVTLHKFFLSSKSEVLNINRYFIVSV